MAEPGLFDALKRRMLNSWDDLESLHTSFLERFMQAGSIGVTEPIPEKFGDPGKVLWTRTIDLWWSAPDKWRFDQEYRGDPFDSKVREQSTEPERVRVSFVVNGDNWAWFKDGDLAGFGTRAEALERKDAWSEFGQWYGCPYLSAKDNAQIQYYCNPRLWLANCDLVLHDAGYRSDAGDSLAPPITYRILATRNEWVHQHDDKASDIGDPSLSEWFAWDSFAGDQEFFDYVDFFQLWVDLQTGFVRRFTKERSSGRAVDCLVTALELNQPISEDTFSLSGSEQQEHEA